jgi:benzoate/toluate 1,2-dioxygenase subunit alpha
MAAHPGMIKEGNGAAGMPPTSPTKDLPAYIHDQPERGEFTVDRSIFTDPDIFDLEMRYIFEGNWVYLAHESQLPRLHDFYTLTIGRQPILLMRNKAGEVGGFLNVCPHRGATVCLTKRGNQKILTCPYHGWSFSTDGTLVGVKGYATGAYPESFDRLDHGLVPIPRLENYRGFLFGSLSPAADDLATYLGEARMFIDMLVDQAPQGLEVVRGSTDYTYNGNWKLQTENGVDGYHFDIVHRTFVGVIQRRVAAKTDAVRAVDVGRLEKPGIGSGCYDLGNGHALLWTDYPNPKDRPSYARRSEIAAKCGETRARWITDRIRNLLLYPNVFFMDQVSMQLRVIYPLAVDKTRIATYCIAPVGEDAATRAHRLRQYEDFFNASGVGTPDDLAAFEACQRGYRGRLARWQQGYARGLRRLLPGADAEARALGLRPHSSSPDFSDEALFHGQYRQWLALMLRGQSREKGTGNGR